jgi:AcrR family transcriptional regulator
MVDPHDNRPAQPRKKPRQQRSVALVEALKESCLRIIRSEGVDALTVARLADVSGVAIGSIYEYFPNIEAIVALIFEDHLRELMTRPLPQHPPGASLRDVIAAMVRSSLQIRRQLAKLHPELFRRYIDHFEVVRILTDEAGPSFAFSRAIETLSPFRAEFRDVDIDKLFFLYVRTLQLMTRCIALEREDYLTDPDTIDILADTLYGLLCGRSGH